MRTDEFIKRILPLKDNLYRVAFRIPEAEELPPLGNEFDNKIIERIVFARKKNRRQLFFSILAAVVIFCIILIILFLTTSFIPDNVYLCCTKSNLI